MLQEEKTYYLSAFRSITIGVILLLVGIGLFVATYDADENFGKNLLHYLVDFSDVFNFFVSLILLPFKLGFIIVGVVVLRTAGKVERAKITAKGLYYKEMPKGNKYDKMTLDLGPLIYISFGQISNIWFHKSWFYGNSLEIEVNNQRIKLITLNVLSTKEKQEIFDAVQNHIKNRKTYARRKKR